MDPPIASQRRFNQRNGWRGCNKALFIQVVLVHASALCTCRRWQTTPVKAHPSLHTLVTFRATCFCCLPFLKLQRLQSKRRGSNGGVSMFNYIYVRAEILRLQHYFLTVMWILFIRRILGLNILWKHKDLSGFQQVCVFPRDGPDLNLHAKPAIFCEAVGSLFIQDDLCQDRDLKTHRTESDIKLISAGL